MSHPNFQNFSPGAVSYKVNYSAQDDYDHPLLCVRCNSDGLVESHSFSYSHIPIYAYLVCILNPLLGLIVIALSAGQHRIDLPFCNSCWGRYRLAAILAGISILVFLLSVIGGVAMMLNFDSGYAFFPLPVLGLGGISRLWLL